MLMAGGLVWYTYKQAETYDTEVAQKVGGILITTIHESVRGSDGCNCMDNSYLNKYTYRSPSGRKEVIGDCIGNPSTAKDEIKKAGDFLAFYCDCLDQSVTVFIGKPEQPWKTYQYNWKDIAGAEFASFEQCEKDRMAYVVLYVEPLEQGFKIIARYNYYDNKLFGTESDRIEFVYKIDEKGVPQRISATLIKAE